MLRLRGEEKAARDLLVVWLVVIVLAGVVALVAFLLEPPNGAPIGHALLLYPLAWPSVALIQHAVEPPWGLSTPQLLVAWFLVALFQWAVVTLLVVGAARVFRWLRRESSAKP